LRLACFLVVCRLCFGSCPTEHAIWHCLCNIKAVLRPGMLVFLFDQQPRVFFASAPAHTNQCPSALQLDTHEFEFQFSATVGLAGIAFEMTVSTVPHNYFAGAVLTLGNSAFEFVVRDGMILYVDGHPLY